MEISLWISFKLSIWIHLSSRDIVVDNQLSFRNINAPGNHVCGNEHIDLLISELLNCLVPLLLRHLREHYEGVEPSALQDMVDLLSEDLGIHEYEGLGHRAGFKDFFYEIQLLAVLALEHELLNVL